MDLDSATSARFRLIYPDVAVRVIRVYEDMFRIHGLSLRCTEGIRTWEYQEKLYAQGRTVPGTVVTHAIPGSSLHQYGCAVDSCFTGKDPYLRTDPSGAHLWEEFGRIADAHGLTWGGSFGSKGRHALVDMPHLECTYGLSLAYIQMLYRGNGMTAVWSKFDQIRGVRQGSEWYGPQTRVRMLETGQIAEPTSPTGGG